MKVLIYIRKISSNVKLRKWFLYCSIVLIILMFLSFVFRNVILHHFLNKITERFHTNYKAELYIGESSFHGINGLSFNNIYLKPIAGDTLLTIEKLDFHFGLLKLLFGKFTIHDLEIENTYLTPVKHDSIDNFNFLFRKTSAKIPDDTVHGQNVNYAKSMDGLLDAIFNLLPTHVTIKNFNNINLYNKYEFSFYIKQFELKEKNFNLPIIVKEDNIEHQWNLLGQLDKSHRKLSFTLQGEKSEIVSIPFISYHWNAKIQFGQVSFSLDDADFSNGIFTVNGVAALQQFSAQHKRISSEYVVFNDASIKYRINIGANYFEMDSTTNIRLHTFDFNPYFKYVTHPSKQIQLSIHKPSFSAQQMFESLPKGLFTNLEGIETKGNLAYCLDFFVDLNETDSLKFYSELKSGSFRIQHFGKMNLSFINEPFEYTAFEDGMPIRTFTVGPENPNFRTFAQIPNYLKYAILTSEDGWFFFHQGFVPDAFRESIITNIKQHRFARGGSTISMQLVKNVYLNRNKTVARKIEEALIVWLIENLRLVSKERMYEVYLNIIEWGPGIYGANEAARFYFDKDVSKLSLAECIFLASIVPRPKSFKYSFDENHQLKESISNYYSSVSSKMFKREQITEQEFNSLVPKVELKGPAYQMLLKKTAPNDSLKVITEDEEL
ncbi:MAG: biosynthetic peptidoglycan transglycosylase [Bacteroidota bacterium]